MEGLCVKKTVFSSLFIPVPQFLVLRFSKTDLVHSLNYSITMGRSDWRTRTEDRSRVWIFQEQNDRRGKGGVTGRRKCVTNNMQEWCWDGFGQVAPLDFRTDDRLRAQAGPTSSVRSSQHSGLLKDHKGPGSSCRAQQPNFHVQEVSLHSSARQFVPSRPGRPITSSQPGQRGQFFHSEFLLSQTPVLPP